MKLFIKLPLLFVSLLAGGELFAQNRIQKMPELQIQGVAQGQKVLAFAVNGKAPLISSGSQAMVTWVNGRSDVVMSVRNQALIPAFVYVTSNVQFVRFDTNYVVLVAFAGNRNEKPHLSRQLDDARCPSVPAPRDLGYNPNEGCQSGKLSPFMGDILGFVELDRILEDPAVRQGRPVVLKRGEDF